MTYEVVEHYGEMNEHPVAQNLESKELAREFIASAYTPEQRKELNVHWAPEESC